jgi:hypothetical protein
MTTAEATAPPTAGPDDLDVRAERVVAAFVRDAFEADLRARIDDAVDRQLAVFLAIQSVPSRMVQQAA